MLFRSSTRRGSFSVHRSEKTPGSKDSSTSGLSFFNDTATTEIYTLSLHDALPISPISRSPLDKDPMPGHLSELHPVNEVNTKGQFFRASFGKNPRFQIQLDKRPLSPGTSREASGVPCLNPRRGLTLLSPVCRGPCDRSLKSEVPCGSCLNWR